MINHWILGYSNKSKWPNWINGIWYWVCHSALRFLLVSRRHHLLLHSSCIASRFRSRFYTDQRETIWSCSPPIRSESNVSDGLQMLIDSLHFFICFPRKEKRSSWSIWSPSHCKQIWKWKMLPRGWPLWPLALWVLTLWLASKRHPCWLFSMPRRLVFSYFSWWAISLVSPLRHQETWFIFGNFLDLSLVSCWEFFRLGIFHCALWSLSIKNVYSRIGWKLSKIWILF